MNLGDIKDVSIVIAGVIAVVTFISGMLQFRGLTRQQRAAHFIEMRRRFLETEEFRTILERMSSDPESLSHFPIQAKRNFVGFLEEIALLVNSKFIRREVAHYMFGYYVLKTDECAPLWEGLEKDSQYWQLFNGFATQMRAMAQKAKFDVLHL